MARKPSVALIRTKVLGGIPTERAHKQPARARPRLPYKPAHFTVKQIRDAVRAVKKEAAAQPDAFEMAAAIAREHAKPYDHIFKAGADARKATTEQERFDFCIGFSTDARYSRISVQKLSPGVAVYGTLQDAEDLRAYMDRQTGKKNFIYLLVKVPE